MARRASAPAAIRVIASQGLSAPTAVIAKEAGISNGPLFTYFKTKADLLPLHVQPADLYRARVPLQSQSGAVL
jgi:hypothetical protein